MPTRRIVQRIAALAACALVLAAAWAAWWPFDDSPRPIGSFAKPTVWQYLFADRLTLGFARLAVAGFGVYLAASIPALVVAGRWAKGFGTTGLETDDAVEASRTLDDLTRRTQVLTAKLDAATREAERAKRERDRALELLSTSIGPIMGEGGRGDDPTGAEGAPGRADPRGQGDG